MNDLKDLNDTKYLLEDSECKSMNMEEYSMLKNNNLNNTQLLLEDKSTILNEIPNNNFNNNINNVNCDTNKNINQDNNENNIDNNNNDNNDNIIKPNIDTSIKDIMENIENNEEIEKLKKRDEQEIIKQQNILLNNQSSHLEELFSLSYTELSHNNQILKNPIVNANNTDRKANNISNNSILSPLKDIQNNNIDIFKKTGQKEIKENIINNDSYNGKNNDNNIEQIYFGVIFPTEEKVKNIYYKNNDKKKIISFKIAKNKNNNYHEYFKILVDKNNDKNYYNLKANEQISIKILLKVPFMKFKKAINCEIDIIDINNNIIGSYYLYANVEIPKLCCLRNKNIIKGCNIPLIKINLSLEENQQFRIPFKNLCLKDFKLNFCLLNSTNENNTNEFIDYQIILDSEKDMIFPSCEINYFSIFINIKKKSEFNEKDMGSIKIKKIIEANIIDTKINYYFCLELLLKKEI